MTIQKDDFNIFEFFKLYPSEESARLHFEKERWGDNRSCPHCGSLKTKEKPNHKPMPYRCLDCAKHFSVRTGTALAESRLPLQKWLMAMYMMVSSKKGVSSIQLAKHLGITQKSAWFLGHRIRKVWDAKQNIKLGGNSPVEADETFIGGKEANKHASKKSKSMQEANKAKAVVFGMKERGGEVRAMVVRDTTRHTLGGQVWGNVKEGSTLYTDQHSAYDRLGSYYNHSKVIHSAKEYVNGMAHTNGIESFWALLKRGYYGIYHHMSKKHLQRYVSEFCGRFNARSIGSHESIGQLIGQMAGKKMSYRELVA